jgi:membrane fusion protein, copper/silver efflux system
VKRLLVFLLIASAIAASGASGLVAGRSNWPAPAWLSGMLPAVTKPGIVEMVRTGPVIYYRDPDGKPGYAAGPRKTDDGRDYLPVHASEDVSFDDALAEPAVAEAPTATGTKRIRFYRNPMGLPDTSPVPKKDSMGMDYLPVYEGEDADDGTVKLSPGKLQKTGVRSEPVERRTLSAPLHAPGIIALDERRVSVVALRFEGFIDSIENLTTGEHVHKGQTLMWVSGPNLASAAAEYLIALKARSEETIGLLGAKGAKRRLENIGVPETIIASIEQTHEIPLSVPWPAPQDGEIVERAVVNGMRAAPGDVLFRIVDHDVVWVMADVAERDLSLVAVGQKVAVRPRAFPDRVFNGEVSLIYPHLNPETRTERVRIELQNPDGLLRPDMYADVEIATGTEAPVLTVSDSAVIDSGARQVVLIDKGDGRFEPRPVKIGRHGDGFVEIREGAAEGDKVVVAANFLIDAESNLKAALQGLTASGEAK